MTREKIADYLSMFISMAEGNLYKEDAISKWKMDKNHIQHYKINSIRWIKVGNIYEAKKIGE